MIYDVSAYEEQLVHIRRENRKNSAGLESGEYLYGFRKEDKLYPAVTFILYTGEEPWQGPTTLYQMLDFEEIPEDLRSMVSDYKINLIDIRKLEDTSVFQTDVKQVFDFIRCANDKRALKELVESDAYYKNMEETAFDVAIQYTKAKELIQIKEGYEKNGVVNVCKALTELIEEGREEGIVLTKQIYKYHLAGKQADEIAKICGISEEKVKEILS